MNYGPLNLKLFRFLYPKLAKSVDAAVADNPDAGITGDDLLLVLYDRQEYILGRFLEITCDEKFNNQLMEYALAHMIAANTRGEEGDLLTGGIQFSKSVEEASALKASSDTRYNGSDYAVFNWNVTQYGVWIETMVQQKMVKLLTTYSSIPNPCKRPEDVFMYVSSTLKINNTSNPKTINLLLELDQQVAFIDNTDPDNPRLTIDAYTKNETNTQIEQSLVPSNSIDVSPVDSEDEDQLIKNKLSVKISEAEGNSLSEKDDGLYNPTADNPSQLVDGLGTTVENPEEGKVSVDLKVNPVSNNQLKVNPVTGALVEPTDLSDYYTIEQTDKAIGDAVEPIQEELNTINETIANIEEVISQQGEAIVKLRTDLINEIDRATTVEASLDQRIIQQQFEIDALFAGGNILQSGIPVLADIQEAIAVTGEVAISFDFAVSGALTGLIIRAEDVPSLYDFAIILTVYMQSTTSTKPAYPNFEMSYNGINFIITNGIDDNILISPNANGNNLFKISKAGGANLLQPKTQNQLDILTDIVFMNQSSFYVGGEIVDPVATIATIMTIPDQVFVQMKYMAGVPDIVNFYLDKSAITDMNSIAAMIQTKMRASGGGTSIPNFVCKWYANVNRLISTTNSPTNYLMNPSNDLDPYPAQFALGLSSGSNGNLVNPQS